MRNALPSLLLGAWLCASLSAGSLAPSLRADLATSPTGKRKIIVHMKDAPGLDSLSRAASRSQRVERLRQNAQLAQGALLETLETLGFAGGDAVERNWLGNSLILRATPDQIHALAERPDVETIFADTEIHLAPYEPREVGADRTAPGDDAERTWGLAAIRALEARQAYGVDGSGVVVGILDTGYDGEHPLLSGKVLRWKSFDGGNQDEPVDDNGHGSHCAGTIGGSSGGGMEIGVAPGVQFVVAKIFSGLGTTSTAAILGAMQWVVDPDGIPDSGDEPRLVSNSWGGPMGDANSPFYSATAAWREIDIAPIFAAGNEGPGASTVGSPGGFPESFAVGATTVETTIANFSSRGPVTWEGNSMVKPDISAPGHNVTSVKAGGGYWTISGTSMACPHVAGLAALMYQANPSLTVAQLIEAIEASSIDEGVPGKDNDWGEGRIDAMAALARVAEGGKIVGAVRDLGGAPLPRAHLVVEQTGVRVPLSEEARFRMLLPEGDYDLAASAFGFLPARIEGVQVREDQETEVAVTLAPAPTGRLVGRILGDGAPLAGKVLARGTPVPPAATGPEGAFALELPVGTYDLSISAFGFHPMVREGVEVRAGEDHELLFEMQDLPPILVVDDDGGKPYDGYFTEALGDLPFQEVDRDELDGILSGSFLSQYEVVIWLTGSEWADCLVEADQEALAGFLGLGGRLFLSGQEVAYSLKSSAFLAESLGTRFVADASNSREVSGEGLEFAIEGSGGANNQDYPDVLDGTAGGEVFLRYGDGGGAAVRRSSGAARVVLLGFGFEAIAGGEMRQQVMNRVLDYLRPDVSDLSARIDAVTASSLPELERRSLAEALAARALERVRVEGGELPEGIGRLLFRKGSFSGDAR